MLIGNKFKVESDAMNVTLFEKAKSKTATTTWRPIAYFSNFQTALNHLVDLEVMETGLKDLKTVVEKQNELYALVKQLKTIPEGIESCRGASK